MLLTCNFCRLAVNIALIFGLDLDLLHHIRCQRYVVCQSGLFNQLLQTGVRGIRTTLQLERGRFPLQWLTQRRLK